MRLARYEADGGTFWGVVDATRGTIATIAGEFSGWAPGLTADLASTLPTSGQVHRLGEVRLLAPLATAANVVGIGGNYARHVVELGLPLPDQPGCFMKTARSIIGPEDEIRFPAVTHALDYEAELVVVIGAEPHYGHDPLRCVLGYTVGNEVSARDLQFGRKDGRSDLFSGKALDGTAPVGPWIVTRDEFGDVQPDVLVTLAVGGDRRQSFRTSEMSWDVASLIRYVHARASLAPGDLLFTGTSTGVGHENNRYLAPGDLVQVKIERIGTLQNRVAAKEPPRV